MSKPELLAPAGDYNSAVAAVEAGADAIYFGGKEFSARNFAVNCSREEIARIIDYAHLRGVKCYAAVNTLVKDAEFSRLYEYINFLYAEGIDALIIQDLGVLNLVQKYWPDLPLHASTQMSAHNINDVLGLEKMGFKRVVLARELTLEEIREIKSKVKIELECFVHGALCFSYSGQCYMSSMIGGRSGNRGRCAQPCRKKYNLAEFSNGKILDRNGYLFSTRDLCALDILDELPFVDSLKIEGRIKNAAYVAGVAQKYRKHIDSLMRNEKISDYEKEADKKELAEIFNRGGFSHGFLLEKKPVDLIATERSKNFGVKVGEVAAAKNGWARIKINELVMNPHTNLNNDQLLKRNQKNKRLRPSSDLNREVIKKIGVGVNDGLEIWGRGGQEMNFGFRVEKISSDGVIEIWPEENADIKAGDAVYKNFDYKLNKKLNLYARENYQRRIPVKMDFSAEEGKNIVLKINGIEVVGEKAEKARQRATEPEAIKTQLEKLGGTVFIASEVKVNLKGELNIPVKDLNAVRREAAEKLEKKIIDSFKREKKEETLDMSNSLLRLQGEPIRFCLQGGPLASPVASKNKSARLKECANNNLRRAAVQSDDLVVLDALANKKISRIYTAARIDIEKFHKNNIEVFQALPRILRKGEKLEMFTPLSKYSAGKKEDKRYDKMNKKYNNNPVIMGFSGYDGFLVPALGYLEILPPKAKKIGDFSLNIFNSFSVRQLEKMGCTGFTASVENTLAEINTLAAGKIEKEAIVYGYLPLMVAEHCVLRGTVFCGKKKCGLIDEKKIIFPIFADCANCRMQVLNSRPLYFTEIDKLEADSIRLIQTIEPPEEFLKKVDNYLSGNFGLVENTTTGHFYRGVD